MHPRRRKVLRDLLGYRWRTVLVVVSIAVGVLAVGMIVESRIVLGREMQREFLASSPANAELRLAPFGDDFVAAAARMPGVAAAEGRRTVTVQVETGSDEWIDLQLTVIPDFADQRIDRVVAQSGTWPPAVGEVVVERSTIDQLDGKMAGDILNVRTPDERTRQLELAGVAYASGELAGYALGNASGFITVDTLERLGFGRSYDDLLLRVTGDTADQAHVTAIADQVADRARAAGHSVGQEAVNAPLEYPGKETLNTVFVILVLLGTLTLVVSVFLVVNTVTAVLGTQTRQIGIMKSIGARDRDLRRLYRGLVLGYGVFAALLSIPLAALGSIALTAYTAGLLNLDAHPVWPPPLVIAIEVVVAVAVPLVAAIAPIDRGVRITIREAIASAGITAGFGIGRLDRAIGSVRFLPRSARYALRNTFRHRRRLTITLAALALGGAVFMAVLSVQASLNATLERGVDFFGFDVQATLASPTRAGPLVAEADRVPDVVSAEPWLAVTAQRVEPDGASGQSYQVVGTPDGSSILHPDVAEGRWLKPADAQALVATDNVLSDEPDLRVGQTLKLTIGGRAGTWTLVGIIKAPSRRQAFYANLDALGRAARAPGRANAVVVMTANHDPTTQNRVADDLRSGLESSGTTVASTLTIGYVREQQTARFNVLVTFLAVMAILVGAVGGIGLSGTMSLSVSERTREIGVLRSLGASNGTVRVIFLAEGWAMGLMAWLVGIVLAVPVSLFLSRRIGLAFVNRPLEFAFSWTGIAVWLAVILVVATLATLAPALAAARVTVRETLAYE
jgi:putative ABC transport system permease protein